MKRYVGRFAQRPLAERFWERVDKRGEHWLWTGEAKYVGSRHRYGRFYIGRCGKREFYEYAHRMAWILQHGVIPLGKEVCHSCDIGLCVRHLFLGTHQENMLDMARKGRGANQNSYKLLCVRGHPFTADNTYSDWRGNRRCKTCHLAYQRVRRSTLAALRDTA